MHTGSVEQAMLAMQIKVIKAAMDLALDKSRQLVEMGTKSAPASLPTSSEAGKVIDTTA